MEKFEKVEWPDDKESAKTIECYVTQAPRAKLYVWRNSNSVYWANIWQYTMSAGRNNDRSHTGTLGTAELTPEEAVDSAIAHVKKDNSWNA